MPGYTLATDGLQEALAGLERVAKLDAQRDLRTQFQTIAEQVIAQAKSLARSGGQVKAAGTLKQASTSAAAALRFGGGFEGAFGFEFGADRNQRRVVNHFGYYTGWNQFPMWRGSGATAGYFLWPAIRDVSKENTEALAESVALIAAQRPGPNLGAGASLIDKVFSQAKAGK